MLKRMIQGKEFLGDTEEVLRDRLENLRFWFLDTGDFRYVNNPSPEFSELGFCVAQGFQRAVPQGVAGHSSLWSVEGAFENVSIAPWWVPPVLSFKMAGIFRPRRCALVLVKLFDHPSAVACKMPLEN